MSTYLAVSAVRIQSWLVRTPKLKLMRGASAALSAVTSADSIRAELVSWGWDRDVHLVTAAGDVDGVVVVTVSGGVPVDRVAERLLGHLAARLPGLDWEAWWTDAESYVAAYGVFRNGGAKRMQRFAPGLDATVARTCPTCRSELAGPGGAAGADCRARAEAGGQQRATGGSDEASGVGSPCAADTALRPPVQSFEDLAAVNRHVGVPRAVGRRTSGNHLVTLVADGNRVGHLFEALRACGDDEANQAAVEALNDATRTAVFRTLSKVAPSSNVQPGIVHFVGGDDVFVSVPARVAWEFAAWLAREFDQKIRELLPRGGDVDSDEVPSLGIGMVFADSHHPIADTHTVATAALRAAKKATRGRSSAVVWADLTVESHPPLSRWVSIGEVLEDLEEDLVEDVEMQKPAARSRLAVMHLPPSARAALAGLFTGDVDLVQAAGRAAEWARRTGNPLPPGLDPNEAGEVRAAAAAQTRDLISRARWWPDPRKGD